MRKKVYNFTQNWKKTQITLKLHNVSNLLIIMNKLTKFVNNFVAFHFFTFYNWTIIQLFVTFTLIVEQ